MAQELKIIADFYEHRKRPRLRFP